MTLLVLIGLIFNHWNCCFAQTPITLSESAIETQAEMQGNNEGGEVIDPGQDYFLNLNANDVAEIITSPILSSEQAQALIAHRQKFGILLAMEELQVTGAFDTSHLRKIKPFVFCGYYRNNRLTK